MTDAQRMSRMLLGAFLRTARKEKSVSMSDEYRDVYARLDSPTYNICWAWASEQQQLVLETKTFIPFELADD